MASHPRTPGELWGRHVLVDLGTEGATGVRLNDDPNAPQLRVAFRVEMTRSSDPHKATIRVWNPSPVTVGLMQAPRAAVRLFVGYDVPRLVFVGNPIRNGVRLDREGPDRILVIEAKDGGRAYAEGFVSASYGGATSREQVLDACAKALGLPRGTTRFPADATLSWPQGLTLSEAARSVLDRICAATRTHWMITDGALVIIPSDGDTGDRATRFSSRTGNLIGAPTQRVGTPPSASTTTVQSVWPIPPVWPAPAGWPTPINGGATPTGWPVPPFWPAPIGWPSALLYPRPSSVITTSARAAQPGGIEVKGLLDASMRPGRAFVVESADVNGTFIARDVTFEGDSGYESPYYVSMTGDPMPSAAATAASTGGGAGPRNRSAA